jgi:hypothetical protein
MKQMKWALLLTAAVACSAFAVACGDDEQANPALDAGGAETGPGPEAGPGPGPDGGPDSGCTFATYVIGLVNTSTTATAQPDTTLGAGCKDSTDQAEFKSLFP